MTNIDIGRKPGKRKFFDIPQQGADVEYYNNDNSCAQENVLQYISRDVIGKSNSFLGPFGQRGIVYCDHIASSRALESIECYLKDYILPEYGNTHTTTSATSLQSTMFQQEARFV